MESSGLPDGFGWHRAGPWSVAIRENLREVLVSAGLENPQGLAAAGESRRAGRGRPAVITLPDESRAVLRRYLHGGLAGKVTGSLFAGASRPLTELVATEKARRAEVSVPEVLAAFHRPVFPGLHRGWLLTREVTGAENLKDLLGDPEVAAHRLFLTGSETRRLHEAGVWHADLHVGNVLVAGERVVLIDFDRARVPETVSAADRQLNLFRFDRSVVKLSLSGVVVPREVRLRFFDGYLDGAEESGRLLARGERSHGFHRLAWRLGIR